VKRTYCEHCAPLFEAEGWRVYFHIGARHTDESPAGQGPTYRAAWLGQGHRGFYYVRREPRFSHYLLQLLPAYHPQEVWRSSTTSEVYIEVGKMFHLALRESCKKKLLAKAEVDHIIWEGKY
jgi:hypothetical protein